MSTRRQALRCTFGLVVCCLALAARASESDADVQSVRDLIARYATSIDRADTDMAQQICSDAPEVSFIHPLGEAHGRAQVEDSIYRRLMGGTFSERKLTPKDVAIHVYGKAAWAEFQWDFVATFRKNGGAFHSQGRETQFYHKEHGQWRLVHVHYSGLPGAGNAKGF